MKTTLLAVAFAISGILTLPAHAQIIPLTIDSTQSSIAITLSESTGTSQLSGDGTFDLELSDPPSGNAQITELNLVLDDGLNISFALGLLAGSTAPGDVTISLVTPGAPGTIAGTSFDQSANTLAFGGELSVFDAFGIAGGNQTVDLSTIELPPVNFDSAVVTQSGSVITVTSSFAFNSVLEIGGGPLEIVVNGSVVASGEVPVLMGDVNSDGTVNCFDIPPFVTVLITRDFQAEADINENGAVNFLDIFPFVGLLLTIQ